MPGVYGDNLLCLDILANAVPDNWHIYFKEHPGTFLRMEMGVLKRSESYYNRVKSYANVRMISTTVNTYDLIDNSKAVATSGGTVGWEALVRGVPPLLFGDFW